MKRIHLLFLLSILIQSTTLAAQPGNSDASTLASDLMNIRSFNRLYPQEKVYLHFDNTAYFKGDTIWYKCYVAGATENRFTDMSRVLYVELLTPEGLLVDSRKLMIKDGQCHGDFALQGDYHSGFYEVRAYTRYMLNWGRDWTFSRVFPVFENPETEGDYSNPVMTGYQHEQKVVPQREKQISAADNVNVTFYPEGGSLVKGLSSRIAFKATDQKGQGIQVVVLVPNRQGGTDTVRSAHQGMGVFTFRPTNTKGRMVFVFNNKKYTFDLPEALPEGYVMQLGNTDRDSLSVLIRQSPGLMPLPMGLSVLSRGRLSAFQELTMTDGPDGSVSRVRFSKKDLLAGVNQLTLFTTHGRVLSERLFFVDLPENVSTSIELLTSERTYHPLEPIRLDFKTASEATFSLSVRDKSTDVASQSGDILTDLLLSSDLKGYIEDPGYYFREKDDVSRTTALDLLMMVQGWRRYDWKQMADVDNFQLLHKPEEGLVLEGHIAPVPIDTDRKKKSKKGEQPLTAQPAPSLDSLRLYLDDLKRLSQKQSYRMPVNIKEDGAFRLLWPDFDADLPIKLSLQDANGKRGADYGRSFRILLDRVFSPTPRAFDVRETTLDLKPAAQDRTIQPTVERKSTSQVQMLPPVAVSGKDKQLTYVTYDVDRDRSRCRDLGVVEWDNTIDYLRAKGMWIIRKYERHTGEGIGNNGSTANQVDSKDGRRFKYFSNGTEVSFLFDGEWHKGQWDIEGKNIEVGRLLFDGVRSIQVYDNHSAHVRFTPSFVPKKFYINDVVILVILSGYSLSDSIDQQRQPHIRATKLEGYSVAKECYSGKNPPIAGDLDFRRTLYWNTDVRADSTGRASVSFYNNSRCRDIIISAEGLTPEGSPLVLK